MDLYYAMTNYHLLCCILHKMVYNKEKKADIYISSYLTITQNNLISKIIESGLFNSVKEYNEIDVDREKNLSDVSMIDKEIDRICLQVKEVIGDNIKNYTNIYLCSDFYSLGFFLIKNKIKYNYFEDGCGVLSQPHLPLRLIEKGDPNRAIICKKLNVFGNNDCVINRYASLSNQIKGYHNDKDIDFDVKTILSELSRNKINTILKIFDVKKINLENKKASLLLTMHYNELMSLKDQRKIYAYLLDFFVNNNEPVIIKPHPADSIFNYEEIFGNVEVLNRYMPAELFPYCIDNKFDKGITCWSTAIYGLKNIIKKIIDFDIQIDKTYKDFDKYYAIVIFLKQIQKKSIQTVKLVNINNLQLQRLLNYYFKEYKKYYTIIDNEECNADPSDVIIITDKLSEKTDNQVIEVHSSYKSNQSIEIIKDYVDSQEVEYIGLYNFPLSEMNYKKEMKYSGYVATGKIIKEQTIFSKLDILLDIMESRKKAEAKEYEEIINKQNRRIWELESHIKYLDRIIADKDTQISTLSNQKLSSIIKNMTRKKMQEWKDKQ